MHKAPTKQKGDIGLTQIMANLELHGIKSALPIADHLPFDLIAINENSDLSKVSVKYRTMKNGMIEIPLRTVYSNSQGPKAVRVNLEEINAFAIYCPTNRKCYYIPSSKLKNYKAGMALRIEVMSNGPNGKTAVMNWASDFENPNVIFGDVGEHGLIQNFAKVPTL